MSSPNGSRGYRYLRWALAAASAAALVYGVWLVRKLLLDSDAYFDSEATFGAIAYTDAVKAAIAQKLDVSKNTVQNSLLLLAALWGLLIAKRDEKAVVMGDWPEIVMFIVANLMFALSFYCYVLYNDSLATMLSQTGGPTFVEAKDLVVMDYREKRIEDIYIWQVRLWWFAIIATAFTLFSAHALKHTKVPDNAPAVVPPAPLAPPSVVPSAAS